MVVEPPPVASIPRVTPEHALELITRQPPPEATTGVFLGARDERNAQPLVEAFSLLAGVTRGIRHLVQHMSMARRGLSEEQRRAAAAQAGRRMIAHGERPLYRLKIADVGRYGVEGMPWLSVTAVGRREALTEARAQIAEWLDVRADAFDLEHRDSSLGGQLHSRRRVARHR